MKIDYDKYISRLQAKRADSPYFKAFRQQQANISLTQQSQDQQMRARLSSGGSSAGATEQAHQNLFQASTAATQSAWGEAATQEHSRISEIDNRIEQLRMAAEQQEEQIKEEKKAKKNALLKTGFQVGGAAIGAAVGMAAGNPLLGAKIGAGAGNMAGSFIGGDGKMAMNNLDPQQFMTGLADTAGSIAGAVTLKNQKEKMGELGELLRGLPTLSKQDNMGIRMFLESGDIDGAINYLKGIATPGASIPSTGTIKTPRIFSQPTY